MHGVVLDGSVVHSARTAGGGAGWAVAIGGGSGGTCVFAAEPSGEHDAEHYASPRVATRRRSASKIRSTSILYGRRNISYGRRT